MEGLEALLGQLLGGVADWSKDIATGRPLPQPPPLSQAQEQLWRLLNDKDEQGVARLVAANPGMAMDFIHPRHFWSAPRVAGPCRTAGGLAPCLALCAKG